MCEVVVVSRRRLFLCWIITFAAVLVLVCPSEGLNAECIHLLEIKANIVEEFKNLGN